MVRSTGAVCWFVRAADGVTRPALEVLGASALGFDVGFAIGAGAGAGAAGRGFRAGLGWAPETGTVRPLRFVATGGG